MHLLDRKNIFAWCIVPYDNKNRTSKERAIMLQDLGINTYAYDWRAEHLSNLKYELKIMKDYGIQINGVWFWLDGKSGNYFDENNRLILDILESENSKTDLWIGLPDDYLVEATDTEKFERIAGLLEFTHNKTKEIGCTISLYNHGGWFGEPANQTALIDELGYDDIGIVYNFHHAHDQIHSFEDNLILIKNYLRAVNINGMKLNRGKIIPVGKGDRELNMIKLLIKHEYKGPIGIIGHTENADVKEILTENLKGVNKIKDLLQSA